MKDMKFMKDGNGNRFWKVNGNGKSKDQKPLSDHPLHSRLDNRADAAGPQIDYRRGPFVFFLINSALMLMREDPRSARCPLDH